MIHHSIFFLLPFTRLDHKASCFFTAKIDANAVRVSQLNPSTIPNPVLISKPDQYASAKPPVISKAAIVPIPTRSNARYFFSCLARYEPANVLAATKINVVAASAERPTAVDRLVIIWTALMIVMVANIKTTMPRMTPPPRLRIAPPKGAL
jgi:hypothetical protein